MKKILVLLFLSLITILFFESIEEWMVDHSFSWTTSKIIPYLLLVIFGFLLSIFSHIFFKTKRVANKPLIFWSIKILVFILPFMVGFAFHPIYQGDFSKDGFQVHHNFSPNDFKNDGLSVIAIPNCPYCFETIKKLKKIKKRTPQLKIDFIVCATSEKVIKNYTKEIGGQFEIRLSKSPNDLAKMARLTFPSFLLIKEKKPIYYWSNDQFGVRAIDEIEKKDVNK